MTQLAPRFAFLKSHNGAPATSSALAADDLFWPHHPVSQVAWQAMVSAADHLDLVRHVVSIAPAKVFITAPFSVARTALIASSQALWVLGSENSADRQQRALSVAIEG